MLRLLVVLLFLVILADPALARNKRGDRLGKLNCETGQVAQFDGRRWRCADISSGSDDQVLVRDADGTVVGEPYSRGRIIMTADDGRVFICGLDRSGFNAVFQLHWTDDTCGANGGIAFHQVSGGLNYILAGAGTNTTAYLPVDPDAPSTLTARSVQDFDDDSCTDITDEIKDNVFENESVLDLTQFTPPFETSR